MKTLTTDQRLQYAARSLKQTITLLRDAAALGTMSESTRDDMLAEARSLEGMDLECLRDYRLRCAKDLAAVRAAKVKARRRAA